MISGEDKTRPVTFAGTHLGSSKQSDPVPEQGSFSLGYVPGLDGVRAVGVLAVMLFHTAGRGWLPGGYMGVDDSSLCSGFPRPC